MDFRLLFFEMSDFEMAADPPDGWEPDNGHPKDIVCMLNVVVQILCMVLIVAVVGVRIWVRRKIEDAMHLEDCKLSILPVSMDTRL